jgi:hypothetical protein
MNKLFDIKLQHKPGFTTAPVSQEGRVGELLGSGDGVVKGPTIAGSVHWSIFDIVGEVCETNVTGVITADNGARIQFDTRGFGTVPDKKRPERWNMPAACKFVTDAEEHSWLKKHWPYGWASSI